jgi:hypothetical protein
MDAVGTDDRRPAHPLLAAIGEHERGGRAVAILLDRDALVPGDDAVGAGLRDEGLVEHLLEVAAVDLELRPGGSRHRCRPAPCIRTGRIG